MENVQEHEVNGHKAHVGQRRGYKPYPKTDHHAWSVFAGLAIEFGGYKDVEVVDPYTGRCIWIDDIPSGDIAGTLRLIADVGEQTGFFGPAEGEIDWEDSEDGPQT